MKNEINFAPKVTTTIKTKEILKKQIKTSINLMIWIHKSHKTSANRRGKKKQRGDGKRKRNTRKKGDQT
jgi:hypothetical protein